MTAPREDGWICWLQTFHLEMIYCANLGSLWNSRVMFFLLSFLVRAGAWGKIQLLLWAWHWCQGSDKKPTAPILLWDWCGRGWAGKLCQDGDQPGLLLPSLQGIMQRSGRENTHCQWGQGQEATGGSFLHRSSPLLVSLKWLFVSLEGLYYTAVVVVMMSLVPVLKRLCGKIEELGSFIFLAIKSRENCNRLLNLS